MALCMHLHTACGCDLINTACGTASDGTPPNPSTIDVMVGSPSKKQTRVRDMLQSFGNLFLVRLVIYYEFERV